MKKSVKLIVVTLFVTVFSCSNDDSDNEVIGNEKTKATIFLKNGDGIPVSNISIAVFSEKSWVSIFDEDQIPEEKIMSNTEGKAFFDNLEYPSVFTDGNNQEQMFRFKVDYPGNSGAISTKVKSTRFKKGEQKELTIVLD